MRIAAEADIPTPEAVRQVTDQVLARPEFQPSQHSRLIQDLVEWLRGLFEGADRWGGNHPLGLRVLIVLLAAVLVGLVAYLAFRVVQAIRRARRNAGGDRPRATAWEVLEGQADDWSAGLAKARQQFAAGAYRQAVWIAHRVLLGLLDQRDAVQFECWKTNTDYRAECPPDQPDRDTLLAASELYDTVIYAQRPADPPAIAAMLQRVGRLLESETP